MKKNKTKLMENQNNKRPKISQDDSEDYPELIQSQIPKKPTINNPKFPSFIVMEDLPITKISPFKIEKILSEKIKPKTVKKTQQRNLAC